jgi:hypothetical protein
MTSVRRTAADWGGKTFGLDGGRLDAVLADKCLLSKRGHAFYVRNVKPYASTIATNIVASWADVPNCLGSGTPVWPRRPNFRYGSTPVIENSEPNLRKGWKADIRSSRLNDASAPENGHSRSWQVRSEE